MDTQPDLHTRLGAALARTPGGWGGAALQSLPDSGLAHWHVRLVGRGALARIPKQSQVDLGAAAHLQHEAACFERAAPSGHVPRLLGVVAPDTALPRGALIVEEIIGRRARLPIDLPAIAGALASLHRLPVPALADRPPLGTAPDALTELLAQIDAQAAWLDAARLDPEARRHIEAERARYRALCARAARPPACLISFDAHPGNFLVRADGRAMLVDLEKCRYGPASLDLAHATLYTSTTWEAADAVALDVDEITRAHAAWARAVGPAAAAALADWHLPLRRAMWLWSITWCAKWRVASTTDRRTATTGEDWSAQLSAPALTAHVRGRVDHYLDTPTIARVLAEFDTLEPRLAVAHA